MPQQDEGFDEDREQMGFPSKGPTGRPGPGGGPGGQVGGGFLSFAGVRPQIMRGITGFGEPGIPITMRKRGFQPGVTPGPPGRGDTVPAMLSPGEMVMNNGVTQDPQMLQQLMALNQQGAGQMGYEAGGVVPEEGEPMGGRPSRALRILQLLLELDDMGGEPEGFALGGLAGMSQGFFGRKPQPGGAQPIGAPAPQGGFNYGNDAAGQQTRFNPANPWGGMQQNTGATGLGAATRLVGQAGQLGAYDPRGNQNLLRAAQEGAQGDADALVRRQMTQANLSGLDPAQAAVAKQQALRDTGRGVQDIMAQTRGGILSQQQGFNQDLLNQLFGADLGYTRNEQDARNQRIAQQNAGRIANQANGGYWGQLAGQAAGTLAGGLGRP